MLDNHLVATHVEQCVFFITCYDNFIISSLCKDCIFGLICWQEFLWLFKVATYAFTVMLFFGGHFLAS
jgi:hypothetical protein